MNSDEISLPYASIHFNSQKHQMKSSFEEKEEESLFDLSSVRDSNLGRGTIAMRSCCQKKFLFIMTILLFIIAIAIITIIGGRKVKPIDTDSSNDYGDTLKNQGEFDEEEKKWEREATINPNSPLAYHNWGGALYYNRKYEEAEKKFEKAISLYRNFSEAYNSLGNALRAEGKYEEADEKFEEAISINHNYSEAFFDWGYTLAKQGKYEEADEKFEEATKINPKYSWAFYHWGNTLAKQGKDEEAKKKFEEAIKLNPEISEVYNNNLKNQKRNVTKEISRPLKEKVIVDPTFW